MNLLRRLGIGFAVLMLTGGVIRAQSNYATPYVFTTLAGQIGKGSANGTAGEARFNIPTGMVVDSAGNLYVADTDNHTVRMISSGGVVTTLAGMPGESGSTDGTGSVARFNAPSSVAADNAGNLYVADSGNHMIRKIIISTGEVTTLAGTMGSPGFSDATGSAAQFNYPSGVAADSSGNVYVADASNNRIRKVTSGGVVTTLAGSGAFGSADGTGIAAEFLGPMAVAVDSSGNVYVADTNNKKIRKITSAGVVTTLAGIGGLGSTDGIGSLASFRYPMGVAVDSANNVWVADTNNHTIRMVTSAGVVTTVAGGGVFAPGSADGTGTAARFNYPRGVAVDGTGKVYVSDSENHTIRQIAQGGVVTTFAGQAARFSSPESVAVDSAGTVYVADFGNHVIRMITGGGVVTTLAGSPGNIGSDDGAGSAARFNNPAGVAVDNAGNLFVSDRGNHRIRKIVISTGEVTTFAGSSIGSSDGTGTSAQFQYPYGLAVDSAGNVYVSDSGNFTIRKITSEKVVTTLAGSAGSSGSADGTGSAARFLNQQGLTVDANGTVYVADTANQTIRQITAEGVVTTLAGTASTQGTADGVGSAARFYLPTGVSADTTGNLYVADLGNHTIRKIVISTKVVTTLAGLAGTEGPDDGTGSNARFEQPACVAVDSVGNVYVGDRMNHAVRWGALTGPTFTGATTASGTVDQSFTYTSTFTGVLCGYTASDLPAGLSINTATGVISGIPAAAGTFTVTLGATNGAGSASATLTLTIAKAVATVTLGSLSTTYNGSPKSATATTTPSGLTVDFTYDGSPTAPTNAGSYAVVGTINSPNYTGSTSGTLVISKATATVILGSLSATYNGSAKSATATTTPGGLPVDFTYNGSAAAPTNVGSYAVVGTINHANYQGSASGTLVISKGTATVTLGSLSTTYNGSTRSATATTSPVGLAVDFTYDGSATAPTNAGSYAVVGTINDSNYQGSASGTLVISKAPAAVTLGSLSATYDGSAKSATATTDPVGLNVTFTYNGSATAPTNSGSYAVIGTINHANYQGSATGTLTIAKAPATVTLGSLSATYNGSAKSATATTSPVGLTVGFTYDGATTAPTNAGSYAVIGTINDANYQGSANGTLVIGKATATVVLGNLSATYNGSPKSATATTTPGSLPVDFTYNGSATAPTNVGSYAVIGTINHANYQGSASGTLVIGKGTATVALGSLSATYDGNAKAATATTTPVGLTVDFTYDGSATAPTNAGSYAVVGTINDSNYQGSASGTLVIGKATATVTLGSLSATYNGSSKSATATTNPVSLPVDFTYNGSPTAPTNAGSYAVIGTINHANYQGNASGTLVIAKASATAILGNLSATYDGSAKAATATTSPVGLTVNFTYNGSATAPTNAGSYAVIGTINDTNYQGSASGTLVIAKATATVSLGSLSATYDGNAKSATATTTPVGLTVGLTYDGLAAVPTNAGSYAVVGTINDTNYQGSASGTLVISKATATVSLGSLSATYTGSPKSASATTTPIGLTVAFTYDGSATAPTNAGSYAVVGTINDNNYQGSASGTLTITKATATVSLGNLSATYDGSAKSATATTNPVSLPVDFTYNGSATTPTGAGSYAVIGTINHANYQGSASGTLVIAKASATAILGNLSATYDGNAKAATATTTPVGLMVNFTYNGSATAPTNAGSYAVVGTINDNNYQGSASGTLVIGKATATVTLDSLSATYNGSTKSATATTNPVSLPVDFTYNGSATAPTNAGSYTVIGTINHANYQGSATGTLIIGKASATVSLGDLSAIYNGSPKSATATTTPIGLTVGFTYDGSATAPTNVGSYAVLGTINDSNYTGSASGTLTITKATATVTLGNLSATYDGNAKSATATTNPASLTVDFTYDGSLTAPTNAGSYAVVGTINHANYQGSTSGTLIIGKATATVTLGGLTAIYNGSPKSATATTNPVSLPVDFTYNGSATAPTNAGSYTVIGTINHANYQGSATGTLVIGKAAATVSLSSLGATYDGSQKSATATTTPVGLTVGFTYDGSATAPINAGSYAVIGTINDTNYTGSASGTLTIAKAAATVTLGSLSATYDGNAKSATATTAPGGLPVDFTYDGSATAPINAGSYAVVGTINHANYQGSASGTLVIGKATATVTLGSLTVTYDGSAKSATATTSPGGLPVGFTYDGSGAAPSNAGSYAVVATINHANYTGSASGTLTVVKATAAVTLGSLSATYDGTPKSATAMTTPVGLTVGLTYDGSATAPTNAGSYAVVGTISHANYQGSASGTLVIGKATAAVTLGSLSATYDGTAKSVTATTTPVGLSVGFTYDGSATAPTNAGSYAVTGTVSNANYQGTGNGTLVIAKAAQSITFNVLPNVPFSTVPLALSATASSNLAVVFTVQSGPAILTGNDLTLTGSGAVTVRASQPGNANYEAAPDVDRTFAVTGNYDSWLLAHFTEAELLNPAISGPNADPDKDGFGNLMEYALALEPKSSSTTGLPEVSNSATHWLYTFTHPTDRTDVTYVVQYSTNLTTWTTAAVGDVSQIGSTASTVTIQVRQALTTANVFFRLKVTQP